MEVKLSEIAPGKGGSVCKVLGEGKMRRRLFDMGITPGARIVVRKVAPLGDPMQITLRSYELTLRKSEAENVIIDIE